MINLDFNYIIIGSFLLITLILGLWAGRNIKTIEDYAVANKSFGVGMLTMTILATFMGASHIITIPSSTYKYGIIVTLPTIAIVSLFILIGIFIAPKITKFKGIISMGELVGTLYGYHAKIITGIIGFLFSIFVVGGQIIALGKLVSGFFDIDPKVVIWGIGLLIVIYSSFGGIRAITLTDTLQFFTLTIVIIAILGKVIHDLGGIHLFYKKICIIDKSKISIISNQRYNTYLKVTFKNLMPVFLLSPPFIQRMLMIENKIKSARAFLISSIFYVILRIAIAIISIGIFLLFPNINSKTVFVNSIKLFPLFLQGFMICGLISIIMSSIDSFLNSAGILVACDVIKPILFKNNIKFNELKQIKFITLIIGIISLYIASLNFTCHQALFFAMNILSTIIIPLVFGILGIKAFKKDFYTVLIISILFYLIMIFIYGSPTNLYKSKLKNSVMTYNLILCLIVYFISHIKNNKGIIILKNNNDKILETKWIPSFKNIKPEIKTEYSTIFCIGMLLIYMIIHFIPQNLDTNLYIFKSVIRITGSILCILTLLKDIWPSKLKEKFFYFFWLFTITYCIPFSLGIAISSGIINEYSEVFILLGIITVFLITNIKGFFLINSLGLFFAFLTIYFGYNEIDSVFFYKIIIICIPTLLISKLFKNKNDFIHNLKLIINYKENNTKFTGRNKGLSGKAKKKAQKAVLLYKKNILSTVEICEKLEISRPTFYKYLELSGVELKSKVSKNENSKK